MGGRTTRRDFLSAVAAGPAVAFSAGANERVRLGFVGFGRRARELAREITGLREAGSAVEIAAACDVYAARRAAAARILDLPPEAVASDARRLLDRRDIDGIVIATPHHLHAEQTIAAIAAEKDVYCEMPLARTVADARRVAGAAREAKRIVQVGVDWCSDSRYRDAGERIRKGEIGRILCAQGSACRNGERDEWAVPIEAGASPETIDWTLFLGSAPRRPFSAERFFRWRLYWDYGGGIAEDLFTPILTRLLVALGAGFPARAVASGGICAFRDGREVPDTFHAILEYPEGFSVVIVSTLGNDVGIQECIRGRHATIFFGGGGYELLPQAIAPAEVVPAAASARYEGHIDDWLGAIRERGETRCPPDFALRAVAGIEMCVRAYRERRVVAWDAEKGEIR
ncbi:MAG: Gfo/Idh/MocA family oxidoreductase [Planctomycetes bacterium]|nr:Gfo/Idh/MocA family oxidoreductase [Planctomycetota bacterium]